MSDEAPTFKVELSPSVQRLLDSPVLTDDQKRERRLYHGQWDALDRDALTAEQRARWDAQRGVVPEDDGSAPVRYWRAAALLAQGRPTDAMDVASGLPAQELGSSLPAIGVALLQAKAHEALAQYDEAAGLLRPIRERFQRDSSASVAELTAGAEVIVLLARLEGRPAADYRLALRLLEAAIDADPLAWEPRLVQARLLADHDNRADAGALLDEVFALNPRCVPAWETAARWMIRNGFDRGAGAAIDRLEHAAPTHPAAARLRVRRALRSGDFEGATSAAQRLEALQPDAPTTLALLAANAARSGDSETADEYLRKSDEKHPEHPRAPRAIGEALRWAELLEEAEPYLREAIRRQPNDAQPRLMLGSMLMEAGRLGAARAELAQATRLNPFDSAAANTLALVEQMLTWPTIETENFVIRYPPGPDAALARDMPEVMERVFDELSALFDYTPDRKTQIDVMPDVESFNVRVAGRTEIGVQGILAVCTGDVIAVSPPRVGASTTGGYHWGNVLRHEYVHVITHDLSQRRVPRWFNEGVAKWAEELRRTFDDQTMLARALHEDRFIPFDRIAEAFGTDQIYLAYLQSAWMVDFLVERWGQDAIASMLLAYADKADDAEALRRTTGMDAEAFTAAFKRWAMNQVRSWGLQPVEQPEAIESLLTGGRETLSPDEATALARAARRDPRVLRRLAELALAQNNTDAERYLLRYAVARPTDPWPQRQLAALALRDGDTDAARGVLEWLDRHDLSDPRWAVELTRLHRDAGGFASALQSAKSALFREPYNADLRELAATVALQTRDLDEARHQLKALTSLEPDEPRHQERLDALRRLESN